MPVLFSELLVPGWNQDLIGIDELVGEISLPCHDTDPELFFCEQEEVIAQAKSLCAICPMKAKCLKGALSRKEPCGVWGGELFEDGLVIERKRKVGRPKGVVAA